MRLNGEVMVGKKVPAIYRSEIVVLTPVVFGGICILCNYKKGRRHRYQAMSPAMFLSNYYSITRMA